MSSPSLLRQPASTSSRADFLISTLGLTYLPRESGYIGILGRSCHNVTVEQQPTSHKPEEAAVIPSLPYSSEPLAAQSHNYYMLTSDHPINYLHFLAPDDTHILIEGGPAEYYTFTPPGHPSLSISDPPSLTPSSASFQKSPRAAKKTILGRDYLAGQVPIISVPGGCWKALRLCEGVEYALTANVLAPEFTEDRVKIGAGQRFVDMFKGRAEWATEEFLQTLIGAENWTGET
jgi:predicted cupin superfamily sugar epimerase